MFTSHKYLGFLSATLILFLGTSVAHSQKASQKKLGIGVPVLSGGWEVTVKNARKANELKTYIGDTYTANPGYIFLIVDIMFRNLDNSERTVSTKNIAIINPKSEIISARGSGDGTSFCGVDCDATNYFQAGSERAISFVFVLEKEAINQVFKLQFQDLPRIPFRVKSKSALPASEVTSMPKESAKSAASTQPEVLMKIVKEFPAPGGSVTGITWDGSCLWLSDIDGTIFKVDSSGKTLEALSVDAVSLAFDGSSFWRFTKISFGPPWDLICRFQIKDAKTKMLSSFEATEGSGGGGELRNDLEWDGTSLWLSNANQYNVFRIDTSGSKLSKFAFPKKVRGVAWDGSYLWLAFFEDYFSPTTISVVDTQGNILNSFPSSVFEINGLAWGNKHLWAVGKATSHGRKVLIYQIDVSQAKNTLTSR